MHKKNRHQDNYDFKKLIKHCPELGPYVFVNEFKTTTIDFANPISVKLLNLALLRTYYNLKIWDVPAGYLCPPIPGRADYIHHSAELFSYRKKLKVLDLGVGANCIYPIIGHAEYDWTFVGSEVDVKAMASANEIVKRNNLQDVVELRLQTNKKFYLKNIIGKDEKFDLVMSNPPFHASAEEAKAGSIRKSRNLGKPEALSNFGGKSNELWCPGGEVIFIKQMIHESILFKNQVTWFTALVSKKTSLPVLKSTLKKFPVKEVRVIEMSQGQKISRLLAWTFINYGTIP